MWPRQGINTRVILREFWPDAVSNIEPGMVKRDIFSGQLGTVMQGRFQILRRSWKDAAAVHGDGRYALPKAMSSCVARILADVRLGTMPIEHFSSSAFCALPLEKGKQLQ